jgi:Fur family ferric uptake transcriptional regulator
MKETSVNRPKAMRNTSQRKAVLVALGDLHGTHPTASEIYGAIKVRSFQIGLATVYRTLDAMVERGDVAAVRTGNAVRYDLTHHHHHHLICQVCGKVTDVDASEVPAELITFFETETGFDLTDASIQLNGTCAACAAAK